jgi:hypothetical protein
MEFHANVPVASFKRKRFYCIDILFVFTNYPIEFSAMLELCSNLSELVNIDARNTHVEYNQSQFNLNATVLYIL